MSLKEEQGKKLKFNSLRCAQSEITDLHNTTGRLQLELKCALNEKELCEYRLAEARRMMCVQSSVQPQSAALSDEALLRSDESGLVRALLDGGRCSHSENTRSLVRLYDVEVPTVLPASSD